jgi:SAM-dependent methyltransferase
VTARVIPAGTAAGYPVPFPAEAIPLPAWRRSTALAGAVRQEVTRVTRRRRRTPARSHAEYEVRWASQLADHRWQAAAELPAAISLSSYGTRQLTALMNFIPCSVPAPAFFTWRAAKIAAIFRAHYPADTPITEIGCGLGKNLIVLAYAGYTRLTGLDPTNAAIQAVQEQAAWFRQPWQAGRLDLLNPHPATLGQLAGQVLFTNHVIEQLPGHTRLALECLLRARPAEVIHIEPCAELLAPARSAADLASWLHIIAADYQRTLLTTLNDLAGRGRLEILEARLLGYSPRLANAPALIRWRPAQPGRAAR